MARGTTTREMTIFEQGVWFTRLGSAVLALGGVATFLFDWVGYLVAAAFLAAAILGGALIACRCAVCGKPAHLRDRDRPWPQPRVRWTPEEFCTRCRADLASEFY